MRFPRATWKGPVPNMVAHGLNAPVRGLVLHIMEGTLEGSDAWFHNPKAQVSAHFGNGKTGLLWQWVDTADRAWAEAAGNDNWISIENEGSVPDKLTPQQIENVAQLLAWLHTEYKVPLALANTPIEEGLGWHGMGGEAWGGHLGCPGPAIVAQRPQIIARAQAIVKPPTIAKKIVVAVKKVVAKVVPKKA